jgi:glycine oxidase
MKVVIIGAGVAGLSIGWRLLQAGVEVLILERAQPARGATWAAAGMISVVGERHDANAVETAFARHAAALWPDFAREIEEQSGRHLGYRNDGKLIVANGHEEFDRLAVYAGGEPNLSMLSGSAVCALEPLLRDDIAGALWDPTEAQVDNRALGAALVDAYLRAGGILQANETVVRIESGESRVLGVRTPFALYEADAYVLAAGAWTSRIGGLPPEAMPHVNPVKGEMIALSGGTMPTRIVWGEGVYLVSRGGRLLVGATATDDGFDTSLTGAAMKKLLTASVVLMPALEGWDVVDHWAGLRPGSPDGLPILGRCGFEGLWVASGQYRNGVLFAPAVAEALSAVVQGRNSAIDIAAFDPTRFSAAALAKAKSVG